MKMIFVLALYGECKANRSLSLYMFKELVIEKNTRNGLSTNSRPFDAYDKFIEAEGHESLDLARDPELIEGQAKKGTHISGVPLSASNGSPGQTRTADQVVNSHPLYQLSYRGSLYFYEKQDRRKYLTELYAWVNTFLVFFILVIGLTVCNIQFIYYHILINQNRQGFANETDCFRHSRAY